MGNHQTKCCIEAIWWRLIWLQGQIAVLVTNTAVSFDNGEIRRSQSVALPRVQYNQTCVERTHPMKQYLLEELSEQVMSDEWLPNNDFYPRVVRVSTDCATTLNPTPGARLSHVFGAGVSSDDAGFSQRDRVNVNCWRVWCDDARLV